MLIPFGRFLRKPVELAGTGLIDSRFGSEAEHTDRFKNPKRPWSVTISRVFRCLEGDLYEALRAKIVNLIGLHLLDIRIRLLLSARSA